MPKGAHEQYTDEVHEELDYLATWLPSARVRVGDVGVMQGRQLERNTTLDDLGVSFECENDDVAATFGFVSDGAVSVAATGEVSGEVFGAGGSAGTAADLRFTRANAVFFRVERAVVYRIGDLNAVKDAVLTLDTRAQWKRGWLVVTQVVLAQRCLVMVSGSNQASASLAVRTAALPAAGDIAAGEARVVVKGTHGMSYSEDIPTACTPLYQAFRVARGVVREARSRRVGPKGRLLPGAPSETGTTYTDLIPYIYEDEQGN